MSLLEALKNLVRTWRRRGGPKSTKRAGVALERLDHRQLLSVNFTGNVPIDFPDTPGAGVVVLNPDAKDQLAEVTDPNLQPLIRTSGFRISAIRVTYDPQDDTLNVGLQQDPLRPGDPVVIAGDADNNGNEGNPFWNLESFGGPDPDPVDPQVSAITGGQFFDFINLGGSEYMGVSLDLDLDGKPDVVAGFDQLLQPGDPNITKQFQVAEAESPTSNPLKPGFGTRLPENEGTYFLANDPRHPNFELSFANFSELYRKETGETLKANSRFAVGAFAGSESDPGVDETLIRPKPLTLDDATRPDDCPSEPPIKINPHEHRHINTAHPTDIRVYVYGTRSFDVTKIDPESVRLGGAAPYLSITHEHPDLNGDQFPDRMFAFNSLDVDLPGGFVDAVVTGLIRDGQTVQRFENSQVVFNRDESYFTPQQLAGQAARRAHFPVISRMTPAQRQLAHGVNPLHLGEALSGAEVARGRPQANVSGTVRIRTRGSASDVAQRAPLRTAVPHPHAPASFRRTATAAPKPAPTVEPTPDVPRTVAISTRGGAPLRPRRLRVVT